MNRKKDIITRRDLLEKGMAAATIGAAGLLASPSVLGKAAQAPAVVTRRRFRAWISRGNGQGRTTLHEVTLRPIAGRQVVVRTEATNLCYSNATAVLGQPAIADTLALAAPVPYGVAIAGAGVIVVVSPHIG